MLFGGGGESTVETGWMPGGAAASPAAEETIANVKRSSGTAESHKRAPSVYRRR